MYDTNGFIMSNECEARNSIQAIYDSIIVDSIEITELKKYIQVYNMKKSKAGEIKIIFNLEFPN